MRRIAQIPGGASAVGPFSQPVVANGFVFTAGQIPAISSLADQPESVADQVRQTIRNLERVLKAAGSGLDHVVKVNTYLTDPGYPTIGHFLEDGFLDPAISSLLTGVKVAGPAVTVRLAGNDGGHCGSSPQGSHSNQSSQYERPARGSGRDGVELKHERAHS